MSQPKLDQTFLTKRDSAQITVETTGAVLRPPLFLVSSMADEAKWRFDEAGVRVKVVDPANVGLVSIEIPANAFDVYDVDGSETVGFRHKALRKSMNLARHSPGSSDAVRVDAKDGQATVSVEREFGDTGVDHRQTFTTINPDSVREEPNLPGVELPNSVVVGTRALNEVVSSMRGRNGIRIGGGSGKLYLADEPDAETDRLSASKLDGEASIDDTEADSIVSMDYLENVTSALYRSHIGEVEVRWGDEFPVRFIFESDIDGDTVMTGEMMIAPRIRSE